MSNRDWLAPFWWYFPFCPPPARVAVPVVLILGAALAFWLSR